MKILPDDDEITKATHLLVDRYNISTHLISDLLGKDERDQANEILQKISNKSLSKYDITRLLILRDGSELFSGSNENVIQLRSKILAKLPQDKIKYLYDLHSSSGTKIATVHQKTALSKIKWHPSGPWPRDFVSFTEFPEIFAGVRQKETNPTVEEISPLTPRSELKEFQKQLKRDMLAVLERNGKKTRCMVTLPTGGGKTRVAVEAFIDWMHKKFSEGLFLVWIAQSEELCEQAILHIKDMWQSREYVGSLYIHRVFGGRRIIRLQNGGAIVASIQQLYNGVKNGDRFVDEILQNTGVMIIDEAHRAISKMYIDLFKRAKVICGEELFPICGLTATPGRSGIQSNNETIELVEQFEANLIKPQLGQQYENDPLRYFREQEFLAKPRHIVFKSGLEYELSEEESNQYEKFNDFPPGFLKKLANDKKRNLQIIQRLLKIPKEYSTLVYACTVKHAHLLSMLLNENGRPAGVVSSDTPNSIRRGLIHSFKSKEIHFICNFGVLTTGFDAPKTDCIVLCRPTTSVVLYEQIVGRGMRGIKFGGTEKCDVIDFSDNIKRFGSQMAYTRFKDFWTTEIQE